MEFLEKNLEDIIYDAPNPDLRDQGLEIYGFKRRQVRIGNYGVCDLLVHARDYEFPLCPVHFTIFELKKDCIDAEAFLQAIRYARGLQSYLINHRGFYHFTIDICLVGRIIDMHSPFPYLPSFMTNLKLFTYKYSYDGIQFKEEKNYKLIEEGFHGVKR